MRRVIVPISALFAGIFTVLLGNGLLALIVGARASAEFGDTTTGIVMSGYFIGFIFGSLTAPWFIRAVGYIRIFAGMAALASVTAIGYGVIVNAPAWWLLRFVSGACLAGIYLVVESWLNEQTVHGERGRVFGLYMMLTMFALGVGLALGAVAGDVNALEPFVLASVFFTLGLIPVAITPMPQPHPAPMPSFVFRHMFSQSPTGFTGAAVAGVANGILWGLGPAYWKGIGLSTDETAVFMALVIIGGALFQWPLGHFSDGRDRRVWLMFISLAAAIAALLTLSADSLSRTALGIFAAAYGATMLAVYSLSVAHVHDRVASENVLAAARTLLLLYGLGAALGPLLAGVLLDLYGPPALPMISAAVLLFLAGLAAIRSRVRAPVDPGDRTVFVPLTRTSVAALEMFAEAADPPPDDRSRSGPPAAQSRDFGSPGANGADRP